MQEESGFCEIIGGNDRLPKSFLPNRGKILYIIKINEATSA